MDNPTDRIAHQVTWLVILMGVAGIIIALMFGGTPISSIALKIGLGAFAVGIVMKVVKGWLALAIMMVVLFLVIYFSISAATADNQQTISNDQECKIACEQSCAREGKSYHSHNFIRVAECGCNCQ